MENIDKFLKQCIKENSKEYCINEFNKIMIQDTMLSLEKEVLFFATIYGIISKKEYKEECIRVDSNKNKLYRKI